MQFGYNGKRISPIGDLEYKFDKSDIYSNGIVLRNVTHSIELLMGSGVINTKYNGVTDVATIVGKKVIPFGTALFEIYDRSGLDTTDINTCFAGVDATKPAVASKKVGFKGILPYNQQIKQSSPLLNCDGLPVWNEFKTTTFDYVIKGSLWYKFTKKVGANLSDFVNWLNGDRSTASVGAVDKFAEWQTLLSSAIANGSKLYLDFNIATGIPEAVVALPSANPSAGYVRACVANPTYEPENGAMLFDILKEPKFA